MLVFPTYQTLLTKTTTTPATTSYVTDDLYLYYDFDDSNTADSTSTTVSDLTSNSINATAYTANNLDTSTFSFNAWRFDSSNDDYVLCIDIGSGSGEYDETSVVSNNNTKNWSLACWFNLNSFAPTGGNWTKQRWIWGGVPSSIHHTNFGFVQGNVQKLVLHQQAGYANYNNPVTSDDLSLDTWYNAVVTYDTSSGYVLYINNTSVDTGSTSNLGNGPWTNDAKRLLGANTRGGSYGHRRLDGWLGTFAVYKKALSSSEVTQNWNALKSRFGY